MVVYVVIGKSAREIRRIYKSKEAAYKYAEKTKNAYVVKREVFE